MDESLSPDFLRRLDAMRLLARKVHAGRFAALQRSRKLGRGIDFADHRPYSPGDDWSDIDWNLVGRMDRLMVRLAEEDTELHLHLLVDVSASMTLGAPSKAAWSRKLAVALSYVALSHLDRVSLWPFGGGLLRPLTPPRQKAQAVAVQRFLAAVPPASATDLPAAARAFASLAPRGIALVISDFLAPGWQIALDALRFARFEPGILHVVAPEDADPPRGEVRLRDAESGRTRSVRMTAALADRYRRAFAEHGQALADHARAHDLFYAHARTDSPVEDVVLRTLRVERLLR